MSMRLRLLLPLTLILSAGCFAVCAQAQDESLQQRMSPAEFKAAGLDKLSAQELKNLDDWLQGHKKVTTKVVDSSGKPVFYGHDQKRSKITTTIVGHFDGWSKGYEFNLANGQQWKSIDPEPHSCNETENAEVQIKPSLLGSWLMYVPSCYANVHVRRVR
ncbi:MAG TPA: hypothetical protein VN043_13125 [Rhodanobacter sp.]|nr:hypothetical protein [Rhodanobacter sp.]